MNADPLILKDPAEWLYSYIPSHREQLPSEPLWKRITWTLFGNDDNGIFGEISAKKGRKKQINLTLKRFIWWQIRNPLHNFTFYVIGFVGYPHASVTRLFLFTTQKIRFVKALKKHKKMFPMADYTGIYLGLFKARFPFPFVSLRINLCKNVRLEAYAGWRERGNFGLSLRFKNLQKK